MTNRALFISMGLLACILLFVGGHQIVLILERVAGLQAAAADAMLTHPVIFFLVVCYVLLLAIPFVPGAELGFLLLVIFGADIAFVVYLATISGMMLSFWLGRMIPPNHVALTLDRFGLRTLSEAVLEASQPTSRQVGRDTTGSWYRKLIRHRYAALAAIINTPGNTVLGGGGGLALAAGASRLYCPAAFLGTVAIAVSPVPFAFIFLLS